MAKRIHIILILGILVASIRLGWIFYERHQAEAPATTRQVPLNPDYYVMPKKLYPYDLKSARQLIRQPVWVKVGYAYPYYNYNPGTRHVDFTEAGKLLPLQRLDIKDVVTAVSPKDPGERQVLAVFEGDGGRKSYATPIGAAKGGDFRFFSDDMFFIEDPHQLYRHWPSEAWRAIDQHQARPGMSELQADFALGFGMLERGSDQSDRTLDYPNGGHPLTIHFENGKAVEIKASAGPG